MPIAKHFLHDGLPKMMALTSNNHAVLNAWSKMSVKDSPSRMRYFFYNITNPSAVLKGEKPRVEEVGPFVYGTGWKRFNVSWNGDESEISYQEWMQYEYIPCAPDSGARSGDSELMCSPLPEDTLVLQPNSVFLASVFGTLGQGLLPEEITFAREMMLDAMFVFPGLVHDFDAFEESLMFAKQSVHDIMWGYEDPKFKGLSNCSSSEFQISENICSFFSDGKDKCDAWLPKCKKNSIDRILGKCELVEKAINFTKNLERQCPFRKRFPPSVPGLLRATSWEDANKPASETGIDRTNVMKTGKVPGQLAQMKYYGMTELFTCMNSAESPGSACPYGGPRLAPYKYANASTVGGIPGFMFPPFLGEQLGRRSLNVWMPGFSRRMGMVNTMKRQVYGMEMLHYELDPKTLQNTSLNPENDPFFQYGPEGLVNMTHASAGLPMFLSQARFYGVSDAEVLANAPVPPPDRLRHAVAFDIDPFTGMPMGGGSPVQMNLPLKPIDSTLLIRLRYGLSKKRLFEGLDSFGSKLYIPQFWMESASQKLSHKQINEFKQFRYMVSQLPSDMKSLCGCLSLLMSVLMWGVCCCWRPFGKCGRRPTRSQDPEQGPISEGAGPVGGRPLLNES